MKPSISWPRQKARSMLSSMRGRNSVMATSTSLLVDALYTGLAGVYRGDEQKEGEEEMVGGEVDKEGMVVGGEVDTAQVDTGAQSATINTLQ